MKREEGENAGGRGSGSGRGFYWLAEGGSGLSAGGCCPVGLVSLIGSDGGSTPEEPPVPSERRRPYHATPTRIPLTAGESEPGPFPGLPISSQGGGELA